jgi:hypothetical protein
MATAHQSCVLLCLFRPSHCHSRWCLDDIADGGLQAAAAALQQLTSLDLGQAAVSKAAMKHLCSCFTQLSSLVINYDATGRNLQPLTGLPKLTRLVFTAAAGPQHQQTQVQQGQQWQTPTDAHGADALPCHSEAQVQASSWWDEDAVMAVAAPLLHLTNLVALQLPAGVLPPSGALQLRKLQRLRYISNISCHNCSLHSSCWRCHAACRGRSAADGGSAGSTAFALTADCEPQVRHNCQCLRGRSQRQQLVAGVKLRHC